MNRPLSKKTLFILIYFASFLYSFHYALPLYIESSFISQFLPTAKIVGLIFAVAALFTATLTFLYPRLLRRFGNYRTTLTVMGLETIVLITLSVFSNPIFVIPLFIAHQTLTNLIFLNLDYFVESFSEDVSTGGIRGIFMTVLNIAIVVAPFIAGLMLTDHDFEKIYLAAAGFMILGFFVIARNFRTYQDPHYTVPIFKDVLPIIKESHDLHSIIFMHFLLAFFYAWMVIYLPIYLNTRIGIDMNDILGTITPIMLLPFVFLEVPLGKLADKKYGEKEILTIGFIVMGLSTIALSYITTTSIMVWALALLITRAGASAVEVMTETYFFKQVGPDDSHLITFMRTLRSTAYIIGPLVGAVVLSYVDFRYIFLVLGVFMLTAVWFSMTIKDTK